MALKSSFCGTILKYNILCIGYVSLITATIYLILSLIQIIGASLISNDAEEWFYNGLTELTGRMYDPDFFKGRAYFDIYILPILTLITDDSIVLHCMCAVIATVSVITSQLLIVGTSKGYKWLLLPWIIKESIQTVALVISSVIRIRAAVKNEEFTHVFLVVLIIIGAFALNISLVKIVTSHFEELNDSDRKVLQDLKPESCTEQSYRQAVKQSKKLQKSENFLRKAPKDPV